MPPAAKAMWPLFWLLVMVAPELSVMLPPVTKAKLSLNVLAPPTAIAPAVLLPMVMPLKPSLNTRVLPLNKAAPKDSVPLPVPKPTVVLAVNGSNAKVLVPNTRLVLVELKYMLLARSVMPPVCVLASPKVLVVPAFA